MAFTIQSLTDAIPGTWEYVHEDGDVSIFVWSIFDAESWVPLGEAIAQYVGGPPPARRAACALRVVRRPGTGERVRVSARKYPWECSESGKMGA